MTSMRDLSETVREQQEELERLRAEVAELARAIRRGEQARHRLDELQHRGRSGLHGARRAGRRPAGAPASRRFSVHARHPPDRVSRPPLDDAAVRRASARRSETNQRFKFLLEHGQTGLSTAFDFPDVDGLRLRPSALGGRGREDRRRHLVAGRHGDAVRRHPARSGLDVDDDQRPGGHPLLLLRRRGGKAGRARRPDHGDGPERHPQGVHGAARLGLSRSSRRCG